MTTFLFWNLYKKPLEAIVANLAIRHNVDVLMLVECTIPTPVMLKSLNPGRRAQYYSASSIGCKKVEIYTKFSQDFIQPVLETNRLTIRELKLPGLTKILLAVTHFQSKLYSSEANQTEESGILSDRIRKAEKDVQHTKTVLVGDLNMNPFENGLVLANKLNAVMTRQTARKSSRTVADNEYPFFYNPMWSHFGDANESPPGTYYLAKSDHKAFFWHIFDQVLLRPDLLNFFQNETLKILTTDGEIPFLSKRGIPDKSNVSDHLPILFKLNL